MSLDRVSKIREFIKNNNLINYQTFNTRNIFNDPCIRVYNEDGVQIFFCSYYNYIEIIGLSDAEYNSLNDILELY